MSVGVVELHAVAFAYRSFTLGPVSVRLGAQRIGLVGPNGAGKTTLMSLIAGILPGARGRIMCDDRVMNERERRVRFAFSGQQTMWHNGVSIRDYLAVARALYPSWDKSRETEWMRRFCLRYDVEPAASSSGTRAKFGILLALCRGASLLLLDEPWNALDPAGRVELTAELSSITAGTDIGLVVSSHELVQIEGLCDRIIFIKEGTIVADGTPADLLERSHLDAQSGMLGLYQAVMRK